MIFDPAHLSTVLREWADVVDQQLATAQSDGDGVVDTLALVLPTQRATEEDARLLQALSKAASIAAAANKQLAASGPIHSPAPTIVLFPGGEKGQSSGGGDASSTATASSSSPAKPQPADTDTAAAIGGASTSGSAAGERGFTSAVEAVVCSEDLIDQLLPFLDDFTLASIMRLNKQWKRVAVRDHQWEERISSFLCNPELDSLGHSIMRPNELWPWYCRLQRSSKDFDARADLPVTPYHYSDMYVWLSLMINDGSQDFFGPLPLGGKVVPLGDGSVLSGGVEVVLEERDSWALECEGETPLAALQAYFSEESQRELLLDFWLMDASKTRCALVARDWGKTVVSPWSPPEGAEEEEAGDEAAQAARAETDFLIKNDNDTCRVYSNGEVHVVLHSVITLTLIESTNATAPKAEDGTAAGKSEGGSSSSEPDAKPAGAGSGGGGAATSQEEGSEGGQSSTTDEDEDKTGGSKADGSSDSGSSSSSDPPLHVFRVSRVRLATCLGLGSAERGVEEIEPEHPEELHRSVMLLAGLLHEA